MSDEKDCLRRKIIANIRESMKRKKIKQDAFKIDTGINIGRLLSMDVNMKVNTLEKIATYLDVSVHDLIK
ncbi:MAG: helix-turn-helix domain-containing protein [Bacteroidetes bacterium]|nr:helix-turn-helix domain-containing protein [Bacteroidota bacterium]